MNPLKICPIVMMRSVKETQIVKDQTMIYKNKQCRTSSKKSNIKQEIKIE